MYTNRLLLKVLVAAMATACAPTTGDSSNNDAPTVIVPGEDGPGQDEGRGGADPDDPEPPGDSPGATDGPDRGDAPEGERDDRSDDSDHPNDPDDPENREPEPPQRDPEDPVAGDCRGADCPPKEDAPVHVVVDDDRHCLHLGDGDRFGINVCGDWRWDAANRRFSASGDLAVLTPVGEFPLNNASLRAGIDPMFLDGSAEVPFPAIGFLEDAGVEGAAPSARIAFAPGRELDAVEINGQALELDPDTWYLVFDYSTGFEASIGGVSLSTPGRGSTMIVAPEEPLIYVGGDLAGLLTGGLVDDAAIGFSLDGRLPYETRNDLYDGERWGPMQLTGHLFAQGSVQLGSYPVSVSGRAIIDADADDDGQTVFEGDDRDIAFGADGSVSLGYSRAGFDLSVEVGTASVVYDASQGPVGHLFFYGRNGLESLFEDTPLEFIEPDQASTEIYGLFRDTDDFVVGVIWNGRMGPFQFDDATLELGSHQVEVSATMRPPAPARVLGDQHVAFQGVVRADGSYSLTGEATVEVAGYRLADASLELNPNGLAVAGTVDIPQVGHVDLSGRIEGNGSAQLQGNANISPAGISIANATVALSAQGAAISGRASLPGIGHADVSGSVQANGQFALAGSAAARIAGFDLANARLSIDNGGATLSGRVTVPGMGDANVTGRISGANTSLTGRADLSPGGFNMAGAAVTLGSGGVHVAGRVNLPGVGGVDVSGDAPANGAFALTGRADLAPAGLRIAGAAVTVRPDGARVAGRAGFAGTGIDVSGEAYANGRYRFSGSIGADAGIFGGRVTLTIENGRVSATFTGQACYPVPDPCASRERVCVWTPFGEQCENICIPGSSRRCEGVSRSVGADGRICVNLPVIGNQCVEIL